MRRAVAVKNIAILWKDNGEMFFTDDTAEACVEKKKVPCT
jgi:hypothetical protein